MSLLLLPSKGAMVSDYCNSAVGKPEYSWKNDGYGVRLLPDHDQELYMIQARYAGTGESGR